jgi:predicted MFS family arabinose efflux permease
MFGSGEEGYEKSVETVGVEDATAVPWRGHVKGSREFRGVMLALFAAGVSTFAQVYAAQGLLPELSRDLFITEAQSALAISSVTLGIAVSVLPWSGVADRYGRLQTMQASLVIATVLGLLVPFSSDFVMLMVLLLLKGIALGGVPAAALTYLKEEVGAGHTALAAGLLVSGNTVGGLVGRIVAGASAGIASWRVAMLVVTVIAAAAVTVLFVTAPHPRGFVPIGHRPPQGPGFRQKIWLALRNRQLLVVYAQGFVLMGGLVALYNYVGFRLEAPPLLMPTAATSLVFLAYIPGIWSARWAGPLSGRLGRRAALTWSTVTMPAALALTVIDWLPAIVAGLVFFTAAFCLAHSVASGWAPALTPEAPAQAASIYALTGYLGAATIGWAGGIMFRTFSWLGLVAGVACALSVAAVTAITVLAPPSADGG